ncbi:tRNA-guanine transglycosylase DpdA [Aliterella atlantica]|uniref:Queuine/archaeosine tRNA-ribosyltransferase n=1 Tax=Aliterella atlantica CENA595 TaxID=1618023 RepID=A0A0D8ZUP5_9CYAN|nr:tRNA-guanine transglycosylase DpdA [Aliterella atlantica]KJH72498.1 queuine/archaeosine tRNA-ribosyltransferase [Aliterella atlantica CENA595]
MNKLRTLVITSCTGKKKFKAFNQLSIVDFQDSDLLALREAELASAKCSAADMYIGMQHCTMMAGVNALRQAFGTEVVDVMILSAGYGLIPEHQIIVPYEVSFNTMKASDIDKWASFLKIHEDFERAIAKYDLIFIMLGKNYLRSIQFPINTCDKQSLIFLTSSASSNYIQGVTSKCFILPLSNTEAKKFSYSLVGLKGFLFKQFALAVVQKFHLLQKVYEQPDLFRQLVIPRSELPIIFTQRFGRSETDNIVPIPNIQPALNYHLGMKYFIPEWDDRIDPKYEFLDDIKTPNKNSYNDEIYAHQIFSPPNYDGILVSKIVFDKGKTKKLRILKEGIHKFIRYQGTMMGDCGAFGYIKEDTPPYTTEEILEYYSSCGFNYGVSIDHLIVGLFAQPGLREKRYQITINNAEDFIQKHSRGQYDFTPIGAVQGWNPESYSKAVKAYIEMGYDYIALGGLARARTTEIIQILQAIYPYINSNTRIHLFGVGRLNAIPIFRHLGVNSFDSASPLRKAWLDPVANYHSIKGNTYAAVRIPKVDDSGIRIKQIINAGVADKLTLQLLEQNALSFLRSFDKGKASLEDTLAALTAYDELLELPRNGIVNSLEQRRRTSKHTQMYKKLLEDKPWKDCNCPICQEIGVEVIIFRGNDRNRRRGFHNTHIFYKRFKDLLADG